MGRHLKNAVRRGVYDGLPRAHMLVPQLLDDGRAGGHAIPQGAPADLGFKGLHDPRREPLWIGLEGLLHNHPRHFPMAAGGILGMGFFHGPSVRPMDRACMGRQAMDALDPGKPHGVHVGQVQMAPLPTNIANGVGPRIPEVRRIRQAADTRAVQHHDDRPFTLCHISILSFVALGNPLAVQFDSTILRPGRQII